MKSAAFLILFLMAICVGNSGVAAKVPLAKGKIFEPRLSPDTPLFFFENSKSEEGGKLFSRTRYKDAKGNVVVEEDTTYENGRLLRYRYHQIQTKESGEIEVKNGKVHFNFLAQGKAESDEEDFEEDMIVPDMIGGVLRSSWKKLMAGESVKVQFLLLERLDTIGFKFFKDKERDYNGIPAVDLIMKPSSFFIAMVAPSIRFTVERVPPYRLLETEGRLPVRVAEKEPPLSRKDFKAIDGRVVMEYPELQGSEASSSAEAGTASP